MGGVFLAEPAINGKKLKGGQREKRTKTRGGGKFCRPDELWGGGMEGG